MSPGEPLAESIQSPPDSPLMGPLWAVVVGCGTAKVLPALMLKPGMARSRLGASPALRCLLTISVPLPGRRTGSPYEYATGQVDRSPAIDSITHGRSQPRARAHSFRGCRPSIIMLRPTPGKRTDLRIPCETHPDADDPSLSLAARGCQRLPEVNCRICLCEDQESRAAAGSSRAPRLRACGLRPVPSPLTRFEPIRRRH